MDPETPRLSLRKKKRILELLDAGVQNSYSDVRNLFCKTRSSRTCFSVIPIGKSFNSRKARRPISEWPTSSIENVICFGRCEITEPNGTFPFLLIVVFSGVKAVYFHFSFQFLCKEMVLVRKSCPDQKLVYTFSDPKFPVKPQLSKGPTTFNSKDSSVFQFVPWLYTTNHEIYEI